MASKIGNDLGSARFATLDELAGCRGGSLVGNISEKRNDLLSPPPVFILGRAPNANCAAAVIRTQGEPESYPSRRSLISWPWKKWDAKNKKWGGLNSGHLITFASTRSGKGVGFILPNLFFYSSSVLVIDPKGENYTATREQRTNNLNQRVFRLDPFNVCDGDNMPEDERGKFNPLSVLPKDANSEDRWELALTIAEAMVVKSPEAKDPHWDEKAQNLLAHFIFYVLETQKDEPAKMHLGTVRDWVTASTQKHDQRIKEIDDLYAKDSSPWHIQQMYKGVSAFVNMAREERGSVLSMMDRHTSFLDSTKVVGVLSGNSFDISDLKRKGDLSVFLVLPADKLELYNRLLRIWISAAIRSILQTKDKGSKEVPVLFMLDEMAQIGPMTYLEKAVSLLAGYGMTMWMIYQDLPQLKRDYPKSYNTFMANAKVQIFFGIADIETATHVCQSLGQQTIDVQSQSKSVATGITVGASTGRSESTGFGGSSSGTQSSTNVSTTVTNTQTQSVSSQQRNLMNPDELMRIGNDYAFIFLPNTGCPPAIVRRINYYEDPVLHFDNFKNASYELLKRSLPFGLGSLIAGFVYPGSMRGDFSPAKSISKLALAGWTASALAGLVVIYSQRDNVPGGGSFAQQPRPVATAPGSITQQTRVQAVSSAPFAPAQPMPRSQVAVSAEATPYDFHGGILRAKEQFGYGNYQKSCDEFDQVLAHIDGTHRPSEDWSGPMDRYLVACICVNAGNKAGTAAEQYLNTYGWNSESASFAALFGYIGYSQARNQEAASRFINNAYAKCLWENWPRLLISYFHGDVGENIVMQNIGGDGGHNTDAQALIGLQQMYGGNQTAGLKHIQWVYQNGTRNAFTFALAENEITHHSVPDASEAIGANPNKNSTFQTSQTQTSNAAQPPSAPPATLVSYSPPNAQPVSTVEPLSNTPTPALTQVPPPLLLPGTLIQIATLEEFDPATSPSKSYAAQLTADLTLSNGKTVPIGTKALIQVVQNGNTMGLRMTKLMLADNNISLNTDVLNLNVKPRAAFISGNNGSLSVQNPISFFHKSTKVHKLSSYQFTVKPDDQ